ncbi:MAG: hypothetical protein BGN88_11525 [Clostridiales bacterium 43-6]|nr:MAG: hypothetical protein BGN88_11525 [Clostridiales bacterium 43-6]
MKLKDKTKALWKDGAALIAGSAVYALSVHSFTAPNHIAPGGVTGISTFIHYLTGFPIGTMMLILNIPILLLGVYKLGIKFLAKTIISTVLISVLIDIFAVVLPVYQGDKILAALYGGVLTGFGLAIIFLRGGTTGGTDIIARVINVQFPFFSMGRIILMIDFIVIVAAAFVFWSIESALYAMIAIYTASKIIDNIMFGADRGKMMMVISDQPRELAKEIMHSLTRGVTIIEGSGAYTSKKKEIILCALRRNETAKLHKLIREIDKTAFTVALEAGEILGEGFKQLPDEKTR